MPQGRPSATPVRRLQRRFAAVFWMCLWIAAGSQIAALGQASTNKDIVTGPTDSFDVPTNGLGSWIWAAETHDLQTCRFWRSFEIPAGTTVKSALIRMTVDDEHTLFLDGREMGRGAEWRNLYEYDLTMTMTPGPHVLAVMAFNSTGSAGMIFGMHIDLADGRVLQVKSDSTWRVVPEGARGGEKMTEAAHSWPAATVIAGLGEKPWWQSPEDVEVISPVQPVGSQIAAAGPASTNKDIVTGPTDSFDVPTNGLGVLDLGGGNSRPSDLPILALL